MSEKLIYIYALVDPRDRIIRYVGASEDVQKRYVGHMKESESRESGKDLWIQELLAQGMEPESIILEEVPYESWRYREVYWISVHRDTIFNIHAGGFGRGCKNLTEEDRKILSLLSSESNEQMWANPWMRKRLVKAISESCDREASRERMQALWDDPEWRSMNIQKIREACRQPGWRAKASRNRIRMHKDPKQRTKMRAAIKRGWADPEVKKRRLAAVFTPETREKLSEAQHNRHKDPKKRKEFMIMVAKQVEKRWTSEAREMFSKIIKETWVRFKAEKLPLDRSAITKEATRRFYDWLAEQESLELKSDSYML